MSKKTYGKEYAEQLLDTLKDLDRLTHQAFYEMGRILYSFKEEKLYELINYTSFKELIEEELTFSYNVAIKYANLYAQFRRLKYNKTEAIELMENFGMRNLGKVLPKIYDKVGVRALSNRIEELDEHQISFWMHGSEYDEVVAALEACGVTYTDSGNFANSSEALVEMARVINGTKAKKVA